MTLKLHNFVVYGVFGSPMTHFLSCKNLFALSVLLLLANPLLLITTYFSYCLAIFHFVHSDCWIFDVGEMGTDPCDPEQKNRVKADGSYIAIFMTTTTTTNLLYILGSS